jgi:hypothetical protein
MEHCIFLLVRDKRIKADYSEILEGIATKQPVSFNNFNVSYVHDFEHLMLSLNDEVVDYLFEKGYSSLVNSEPINEAIVTPGTNEPKIVGVLKKYLTKMQVDKELIIIDPYFFPSHADAGYPDMIAEILKESLAIIDDLIFVTSNKVNTTLKTQIESKLKSHKSSLNIRHAISANYHDRYWITNKREKGLLTGTSLNGLGKRLSLVDRLNTSDVREIVNSLQLEGII